jgi:hypothetical protein
MIADSSTLAFVPAQANFVAGIRNETAGSNGTSSAGPPTCPSMNGTTITDARGAQYSVMCSRDGQGTLITNVEVKGSGINGCFAACDSTPQCGAFTFSGDSTMTSGTCYLKENPGVQNTSPVADTIAEAVLVSPATVAASSSSSAPTGSNGGTGTGTGTGGSGTGSGSAASSSVASSSVASSSTASFSAACTGPPLPSGSGSPTVVNPDGSTSTYNGLLASPTRCDFGDPIDTEEDDSYCEVDLPFAMAIYGGSSAQTFPSTNGVRTL